MSDLEELKRLLLILKFKHEICSEILQSVYRSSIDKIELIHREDVSSLTVLNLYYVSVNMSISETIFMLNDRYSKQLRQYKIDKLLNG